MKTRLILSFVATCFVSAHAMLQTPKAAVPSSSIPLCPGLAIVTAVSQTDGDYESIKTIESVGPSEVRLKYSSEVRSTGWFDSGPPLKKTTLHRTVLTSDLESAKSYQQTFLEKSAETIPGTTAIGTSATILRALKTKGEAELSISNTYGGLELTADRNTRPNYYNYLQVATIKRVGAGPTRVPVLVNDQLVELPAIQAQGESFGDKVEFFFLDDERNPLTLAFRIGIGGIKPLIPEELALCDAVRKSGASMADLPFGRRCERPAGGDRDTLRVIKITSYCVAPPATSGSAGTGGGQPSNGAANAAGGASALERALAEKGTVDVYSIYFSFNSDAIREESEPTLREIAEVLRRHPDWKLGVNGHTDSIGNDPYNLDLSKRRGAAVKNSLVARYAIAAARLTTSGFGRAQPKDTNDTLEGRARNRRVELVRQ